MVPSNITVEAGQKYSFSASGEWTDLREVTGPDGYMNDKVARAKDKLRFTKEDAIFFTLIGCVGADPSAPENCFKVGSFLPEWHVPKNGGLYFYANDLPETYGNNQGAIQLTVTKLV